MLQKWRARIPFSKVTLQLGGVIHADSQQDVASYETRTGFGKCCFLCMLSRPHCGRGYKASLWWCQTDVHDTACGSRWRMHWHDAGRLWEAAHQKVSKVCVARLLVVTVGSLIPSSVNMVEIRHKRMGILELEHTIEHRSNSWLASHLWRWDEKIAYWIQFLYFPASLLLSFPENPTLLEISSVRSAA